MTKVQAGIAVVAVALLAGSAGVGYHLLRPDPAAALRTAPGSPRSVVYALLKGMRDGDGELIRQSLHARDAHEREAVDALVGYSVAARRLDGACERAFGVRHVRLQIQLLPLSPTDLEGQVAQLNEVVDDELADVDFSPISNPSAFHLCKVEGGWKVMVRETFDSARAEETGPLSILVETLRLQAESYTAISDDIESGKITTSDEVQIALHRRMAESMRRPWPVLGPGRSSQREPGVHAR